MKSTWVEHVSEFRNLKEKWLNSMALYSVSNKMTFNLAMLGFPLVRSI